MYTIMITWGDPLSMLVRGDLYERCMFQCVHGYCAVLVLFTWGPLRWVHTLCRLMHRAHSKLVCGLLFGDVQMWNLALCVDCPVPLVGVWAAVR